MSIQKDLQACEKMISVGSTTFYKAFSRLPSPRREAVYVIYSFCRLIDDAVDEPDTSAFTLDDLRRQFDNLPNATGHFIWPALRWLFDRFPVDKQPFYRHMDGQERDFHISEYDSLDQFEEYCYLVAGTVGEMLLPVLHDQPDERVANAGIYLGKAMQIVNIIRDVGEDMRRGRRYIPLELMEKHGYSLEAYAKQLITPAFRSLIEELARLANQWFERGMDRLDTYPQSSAFCIRLASEGYHAILDVVRDNQYDVFNKRAVVSDWQKLRILHRVRKEGSEVS